MRGGKLRMRDLMRKSSPGKPRLKRRVLGAAVVTAALVAALPAVASAAPPYPSDSTPPEPDTAAQRLQ